MKRIIATTVFTMILPLGTAIAGAHNHGFIDTAKVVRVKPLYETVEVSRPVRECWTERVVHRERRVDSYTGTLAGGIVGGVLGNQFGHGKGRRVLTVAGSLLGASIGHDLSARSTRPRVTLEKNCELVDHYAQEEQLVGYRVKYRYKGQTFVTRTQEPPGKRIRIRVSVDPVATF